MADTVLVLNQNFEPLNVCSWRRAFVLVSLTKAEVLEFGHHPIHTAAAVFPRPSVIRLMHLVRRPRSTVKLTRREIFLRDNYTCQYCGQRSRDLTVDHIMPKHRGGRHSWDNLVSACKNCNHRKGGRTPDEARMTLLKPARAPQVPYHYGIYQRANGSIDQGWLKFVPGLEQLVRVPEEKAS
ncbi:MAG TPA: HNH endonuclease [Chloroflexota bacterium]|nr:HNH endonuclease [Chloroflexota bacterium]